MNAAQTAPALELRGLCKSFRLGDGCGIREIHAVRDLNLVLPRGKVLGLVGESGSGKTTTGMLALRLSEPSTGRILLEGADITHLGHAALKPHRRRMQVVFQDSYSALDPMFTLLQSVAEPMVIHSIGSAAERRELADDWLARVGLAGFGDRYPHELSGGQRQRVAIARALILKPSVLVADEPTSALDVSVKAQIINLLMDLQEEMGLSILFISHDLSVVRSLSDRVAVMWNGRMVEEAATETVFQDARHPYTQSLLDAIPAHHPSLRERRRFRRGEEIAADIARIPAHQLPPGSLAGDQPQLVHLNKDHRVEVIVT
ncbi:ATP-binding cassette domain-containing protein [Devosia sp.]|uniref:ATP-binding cassette domain-containing protein n=1 Tax=Devosia sp. TaxID=1871048 RepID=UPI002AFE23BC|nr:ATP-binding cassette domain-containing protein [Devosia sp.]